MRKSFVALCGYYLLNGKTKPQLVLSYNLPILSLFIFLFLVVLNKVQLRLTNLPVVDGTLDWAALHKKIMQNDFDFN